MLPKEQRYKTRIDLNSEHPLTTLFQQRTKLCKRQLLGPLKRGKWQLANPNVIP